MLHIAMLAAALQTAPPPPATPPPRPPIDCTDADHSAFNFWLGEWDVSVGSVVLARSTISPVAGGCAVEENFHQTVGRGGVPMDYHGASYSVFDPRAGKWRQFYVDSNGSVTQFEGGVVDGAMVLIAPSAGPVIQRMIVAPQPDGTVRQTGSTSSDGGATWSAPGYDFTYRRR